MQAEPKLSLIEREVISLVALDLSNSEIAARMQRSEQTIKFHITNVLERLGLRSRVGLAVWHVATLGGGTVEIVSGRGVRALPQAEAPRPKRCWACEYREVAEQAALAGLSGRVVDDGVIVSPNGRAIKLRTLADLEALKTELGGRLSVARTV